MIDFGRLRSLIIKFRFESIALIFTIYGMYLRFLYLVNHEFWTDELFSLKVMQGAWRPVWQRFNYTDYTFFPGEYIINWPFVFLFKNNKWGIAIPHILFTLLGFYLLYLICKRYLHSTFAWIATFALFATHRELIIHSFELRPYAVLPTLALAAFYFIEQIVSSRYNLSFRQKALIGLCFIFTIIYHSYGSVILFFTFAYFLLRESGERNLSEIFRHNYRFIGIMIITGLPLFLWYSLNNPYLSKVMNFDVFQFIPNPIIWPFAFIKCVLCNLTGYKKLYFLALALIFPFVLPYRIRLQQIGFLLILVILPIMVIFFTTLSAGYWFLQRQFTWVMPLFVFFLGWAWDSFFTFLKSKSLRKNGN